MKIFECILFIIIGRSLYSAFVSYQLDGASYLLSGAAVDVAMLVALCLIYLIIKMVKAKSSLGEVSPTKRAYYYSIFVFVILGNLFTVNGMASNFERQRYQNMPFEELSDNPIFSDLYWSMRDNPKNQQFSNLEIGVAARNDLAEKMADDLYRNPSFFIANILVAFILTFVYKLLVSWKNSSGSVRGGLSFAMLSNDEGCKVAVNLWDEQAGSIIEQLISQGYSYCRPDVIDAGSSQEAIRKFEAENNKMPMWLKITAYILGGLFVVLFFALLQQPI